MSLMSPYLNPVLLILDLPSSRPGTTRSANCGSREGGTARSIDEVEDGALRACGRVGPALAREAVALTDHMDGLNYQGDALCDLAEVLHAAGRTEEAATTLEQALERYELKTNLAMAAQVRDRLAQLQEVAPR